MANIPEGWLVLLSAEALPSPASRQMELVRTTLLARGHGCEVWPLLDAASRRADRDFLMNLGTWRKRFSTSGVRYLDVRGLRALPYLAVLTLGYSRLPKITLTVESGPPTKFSLLPRRAMRRVSQVLTTSPEAADAWRKVFPGPVHVLPPLARTPSVSAAGDDPRIAVRASLNEPEPVRTAIWNFDILKYAFPTLRLQVLGTGSRQAELEAFAHSLGRDDTRVDFLGEPENLDEVLGRATVIWVGSPDRACPYALAEAFASGRPVVTWDHPEHRFGAALLADRTDPIGLAKRTQPLMESPTLLAEAGEAGGQPRGAEGAEAWVAEYVRIVGPPAG